MLVDGNEQPQTAFEAALEEDYRLNDDRHRLQCRTVLLARGLGAARAISPQVVPDDTFLEVIDG